MTVPTGEYAPAGDYDSPEGIYDLEDEESAFEPVPVLLAGTVQRQNAPDMGGTAVFTAPPFGPGSQPVQVLQRRPTREQAYVHNNDPVNALIIAERVDKAQQGIGFTIAANGTQKLESQQPYYAVGATAAVVVSVLDEAWLVINQTKGYQER